MAGKLIDYSLYLVTDSTLVPDEYIFLDRITVALQCGITVLQLREKSLDTGPFIDRAKKVKALTSQFNVPLIINDRVDVALAIDADGVHIGQDDMHLAEARRLLGHDKIIGVSANDEVEAAAAILGGADYLGIGAVWPTPTKQLKQMPLGVKGVQRVLASVNGTSIKTVAIGGINCENAAELLRDSSTQHKRLDGLAIVSAIMAANDPRKACCDLSGILRDHLATRPAPVNEPIKCTIDAMKRIKKKSPIIHHITNYVVMNDNANATLAVGASPIMSTNCEELKDLTSINGAMLINMGTLNDIDMMIAAAEANLQCEHPVIVDPVGVGATSFRMQTMNRFLQHFRPTIIKGNGSEILALAGRQGGNSRGVDSVGDLGGERNAVLAVKMLSHKHKCIVAMTGSTDYVSDGIRVYAISNGDPMLTCITGSGCMVSSVVACFAAVNRNDYLLATIAGILAVTIASELAMKRDDVRGPGTFRAALLDELYVLSGKPELIKKYAKIREI